MILMYMKNVWLNSLNVLACLTQKYYKYSTCISLVCKYN